MGCWGARRVSDVRNVRISLPTMCPGPNLESFIAVSSSPLEAAPMGPGGIEHRDAALCHGLDPEP